MLLLEIGSGAVVRSVRNPTSSQIPVAHGVVRSEIKRIRNGNELNFFVCLLGGT